MNAQLIHQSNFMNVDVELYITSL